MVDFNHRPFGATRMEVGRPCKREQLTTNSNKIRNAPLHLGCFWQCETVRHSLTGGYRILIIVTLGTVEGEGDSSSFQHVRKQRP